MADQSIQLQQQVQEAHASTTPLCIQAGNSKHWYGRKPTGKILSVADHTGIVAYRPAELTLTVRAGTPLQDVRASLAEHAQHLAFEPPAFSDKGSIGGTVACAFSGPGRSFQGACRDYVLGCRIINGRGEILRFGGEVMKNVAGFDVSRLMVGSLGTLGVLLDISFKIMPQAQQSQSFHIAKNLSESIALMRHLANSSMPLTALAADQQGVYLRLTGCEEELTAFTHNLSTQKMADASHFWSQLREQNIDFFQDPRPLWRFSLPPSTAHLTIPTTQEADWFFEWGGAQRWLYSDLPAASLFQAAQEVGGHASLFRRKTAHTQEHIFQPLSPSLMRLHQGLKKGFDPKGILNMGRLYKGL